MAREHHARLLRVDELLHDDRDVDRVVVEALFRTVIDRTGAVERCPALLDGLKQVLLAADVEVGLLLAGKGRIGQVFGGGRRPDSDDHRFGREPAVGKADVFANPFRHRRLEHQPLRLLGGVVERSAVLNIEPLETGEEAVLKTGFDQKASEGLRRHDECPRNGKADRGHLSQRSPLASNRRDVLLANLLEHQGIGNVLWNTQRGTPLQLLLLILLCVQKRMHLQNTRLSTLDPGLAIELPFKSDGIQIPDKIEG
ncbi:hypothetical protein DSECCO2_604660 [anaerobic digester metagenome]